jgi:hypothetical protein
MSAIRTVGLNLVIQIRDCVCINAHPLNCVLIAWRVGISQAQLAQFHIAPQRARIAVSCRKLTVNVTADYCH